MNIYFEQAALDYLKKKGLDQLTIDPGVGASCGASGLIHPVIRRGKPALSTYPFIKYEKEGICVYVPTIIRWQKDRISIGLKTYIGIKTLVLLNAEEGK